MTRSILAALALLAFSGLTHAQTRATVCNPVTPNNAICLDGVAPTQNTDGFPITRPLVYRLEQRTGTSGTWSLAAEGLTAPRALVPNLAPGTYQFRLYANCAGCIESWPSPVATGTATAYAPQPNPPTITIAVTITANAPPTAVLVNGAEVFASATP